MSEDAPVRVAARAPVRCSICHGDLGRETESCSECGTACHHDCRAQLGRCPTLGCARASARIVRVDGGARPRITVDSEPSLFWASVISIATGLGTGFSGVVALLTQLFGEGSAPGWAELFVLVAVVHFLVLPTWWCRRFMEHEQHEEAGWGAPLVRVLAVGLFVIPLVIFVIVLFEAFVLVLATFVAIVLVTFGPLTLAWIAGRW